MQFSLLSVASNYVSDPTHYFSCIVDLSLVDLGVTMRIKYGYLLQNFTESNTLPVFRTESQYVLLVLALFLVSQTVQGTVCSLLR